MPRKKLKLRVPAAGPSAQNYASLKSSCESLGVDLFGVADIKKAKKDFVLSETLSKDFNRAISLGVRLSESVLKDIKDSPTPLYFHHYRTVNILLDQIALKVGNFIEKKGYLSLSIPASQVIDWRKQRGHLSHKNIGYLAGLGWIGRNNLLVNKKLGCRFRLASVLTNMPLKPAKPLDSGCGSCRACVEACPAQAIKESSLDFDHLACFKKLKEFQKREFIGQNICGVCISACVKND